jgi:hypothetical protein
VQECFASDYVYRPLNWLTDYSWWHSYLNGADNFLQTENHLSTQDMLQNKYLNLWCEIWQKREDCKMLSIIDERLSFKPTLWVVVKLSEIWDCRARNAEVVFRVLEKPTASSYSSFKTTRHFFLSSATTCPSWTSWFPSWLWLKCNRLLWMGHPWGTVTLSQWSGWWYINMEYQEGP